ncbi:MAG: carboxyl transferase [Lachnospiraceae bacterium]|jgi:acetyl-CoA carboxylase carboxyltransferase component|nr:carboxyl transferase [Lachnospiraceae bacterium]
MSGTAKLSAKDRIYTLLDDNSFVEIGALVTKRNTDFNMQQMSAPGDGIVTGYGVINDNLVYVYSQDASALSGTIGEMHAKKIINLYRLAMKTGAPVIGLIDCAGIRLQEASDALASFGRLYKAEAMASGVIPQITAVFGECGGGLAVLAEMSDFVLMSKDAKLFVTAPNAIAGNNEGKLDTASASYMAASGAVDYVGEDEVAVLNKIRDMVNILPVNNEDECVDECTDDLNRPIMFLEDDCADPALTLSNLSDNGEFVEIKADYAKEMVTGFIKLNGATVGAIGNRTALKDGKNKEKFDAVLTAAGCRKASAFVNYCDAFGIPVLTLSNVTGYSACACDAKEVATEAAKMTFAFAGATVPKINVVTGKAYGTAYAAFNSKSLGADMEFALTGAEIGTMDAKLAAQIVFAGEVNTEEALNEKAAEYSRDYNSAENAAKRGYVDAIIDPSEMRAQIIYAFEMLSTKKELRPSKKHGTV